MQPRICLCCGEKMPVAVATNPNVCPGCAQLLDDDTPMLMALNAVNMSASGTPAHEEEESRSSHIHQHLLH